MLARIFTAILLFTSVSAMAASRTVVVESETGMLFGDPYCRIVSYDGVNSVQVRPGFFDYLEATVTLNYTCVTHEGQRWHFQGTDLVNFLTPEFNWETQAWDVGNTWFVRRLGELQLELNPALELHIWTDPRQEGIAFRVQYLRRLPVP